MEVKKKNHHNQNFSGQGNMIDSIWQRISGLQSMLFWLKCSILKCQLYLLAEHLIAQQV